MHETRGHVAVVNAGAWGTALAVHLANRGHAVRLWCRRPELAEELRAVRENRAYLPGVGLGPNLWPTGDMAEAVRGAGAVLLVPISRALRETARAVAPHLSPGTPLLHATKGFQHDTLQRLSEVVEHELGAGWKDRTAVLSGPTHAEEVGRGMPTACVVASRDAAVAAQLQGLLHGPTMRVYTSTDVVGVEVCGALKNVVALATGGGDGLGFGDNARAAVMTRSLAEMSRLVVALGGDPRTVAGLAGLGDIIATCTSRHSRNRWAGEQIGRGRAVAEILASTPQVVEGIPAALAAIQLADRHAVELPVAAEVHRVVHLGAPVRASLANLMSRAATTELRAED